MRIKTKLVALFAIPILALGIAAFVGFRTQSVAVAEAEESLATIEMAQSVHRVTNAVAAERFGRLDGTADIAALEGQSDEALAGLDSDRFDFPTAASADARELIDRARGFDSGWLAAPAYGELNNLVHVAALESSGTVADPALLSSLQSSVILGESLENSDLAWLTYFSGAQFAVPDVAQVSAEFALAEQGRRDAVSLASGEDSNRLNAAFSTAAVRDLARIQDVAIENLRSGVFAIDADRGIPTTAEGRDVLASVQAEHDASMAERALEGLREESSRRQLFALLAAIGALVVAGMLYTIYRSIALPIAELVDRADHVANVQLPAVVARLRSGNATDLPDPPQIKARANDEIGEVVRAFNAMQTTAHELATEQAISRRNVADMFVNLGRRNQQLVQRMISKVTELEREEDDPEALESLFALDHMVTRMRRNAESLLVLAGSQAPRQWAKPVSIENAVRGSLTEVEMYQRIEMNHMDQSKLLGSVVVDITHLLAELLENAVSFSDPSTPVTVDGQATATGYLLSVTDFGIGMSDSELLENNNRLHNPPELDLAPTRFLGLFVVGRLADRHGIHVTLGHGARQGTVARIEIPLDILAAEETSEIPADLQSIAAGVTADLPPVEAPEATQELHAPAALQAPVVVAEAPEPVFAEVHAAASQPTAPRPAPAPARAEAVSTANHGAAVARTDTRASVAVSEPTLAVPSHANPDPLGPLPERRRNIAGGGAQTPPEAHRYSEQKSPRRASAPAPAPAEQTPRASAPTVGAHDSGVSLPSRQPVDTSLPVRQPGNAGARGVPAPQTPAAPSPAPEQAASGFSSMMSAFSSGVNRGIEDSEGTNEGNGS